jgi:hypothetical protein
MNQEVAMNDLTVYQAAHVVQLPPATLFVLMRSGVIASRHKRNGLCTTDDELRGWARRWGSRLSAVV